MRIRAARLRDAARISLALMSVPGWCATHTVVIEGMQFSPQTVKVKRGDKIVWVNKDLMPHTASAGAAFDSGSIAAGKSWRMVAAKQGRIEYVCALHPTMKAVLIVE